ncbi:MAG: DegQ family serine endoprotease [Endozoicomonas sp. (ex Botrylloides leachii)]|nr:DegQ family serine endoprotease [Endozoicomonas sp. (ex Botrylloides leachii)]
MNRMTCTIKNAVFIFIFSYLSIQLAVASDLPSGINKVAIQNALPDFTRLFKEASPAVVNISSLAKPSSRSNAYGLGSEQLPEIFRRYFGIPYPDQPSSQDPKPLSLGSGFIISPDGYILTNSHVVDGADEIIVKLSNRRELPAKIIGLDKRSDLALLKIDTKEKLPVVKLGDSSSVKPGQWVAAIGSPFDFEYSITKGIVSALNRSLPGDAYVPFIQTDVPINSGNSGSPLFNMNGEVIGITSKILSQSGGFIGLSFAIPIDHAMWAVKQIKKTGHVTRGWLGVAVQEVDRDLAESFGLKTPTGALINLVIPGAPADKAKLHPGDIIVKFDKHPIYDSEALPMNVGTMIPGTKANIEYMRNGKLLSTTIVVGQLPDKLGQVNERVGRMESRQNRLGIQVKALNNNYRNKLNLDDAVTGMVVINADSNTARSFGLRQGDVITDINKEHVGTVEAFNEVVKKLPTQRSISMRVIRDGQPGYITFRLTN